MKQLLFALLPAALLAACSTNPDGSVNWSDNPLNQVATKVDNGVQKLNRNTDKVIAKTGVSAIIALLAMTKECRTSKCSNGATSAAIPTIRNTLPNVMSSLRATATKRASRCASAPARILPNGRRHPALFSGCLNIRAV